MTQKYDNETVESLTAKCEEHACGWAPVADNLNDSSKGKKVNHSLRDCCQPWANCGTYDPAYDAQGHIPFSCFSEIMQNMHSLR